MFADIHANLTALEAVLGELAADVDEIWALGDHVGYGPDPEEVLALLHGREVRLIAGNHDRAVATGIGADRFPNADAAAVALLHRTWLSARDLDLLASLPSTSTRWGFTLFHGSFEDPLAEYVFDTEVARRTIESTPTPLSCNGHTHIPAIFTQHGGRVTLLRPETDRAYALPERGLLNPGSVGQPRDGDPRASWAVIDTITASATFHRTRYDIGQTQERMRRRGLPDRLARRLAMGT